MKFYWGRGLPFLLIFFSASAWAQGVVFLRKGYVQVNGRAVEVGDSFRSGSEAVTEEGSALRVSFMESSFVHAGPKTKFTAVSGSESTMVTLASGWVWVRAGSDRLVSVSSGDAKVEAQGADFIFRAAGSPRVLVLEGQVRFFDGAQVQMMDGADLAAGQMPYLSDLSTGAGSAIAIERRFLHDVMARLGAAKDGRVTQGAVRDGKPHGVVESWKLEDGLRERAVYDQGVLSGPFAAFYGDERPQSLGRYESGQRSGPWTNYYENGIKADEGEYLRGRRIGVWKFYSPGGRLVRVWDYSRDGASAIPRWQWGLAYLGASQKQGSYHSGSALVTGCVFCDSPVAPRFDLTATWLKFQEESTGAAFGAHLGVDVVLGPAVLRGWYGIEHLVRDPFRTSIGLELTRAVGRDMHSRDWQPFVRVSRVEMGARSDITILLVGLWERF